MKSVDEIIEELKVWETPTLKLIDQVVLLIRLQLVIPTSTATAERSFSALRRLKTYLRATMTSIRDNSVAMLNVHKDLTDSLDSQSLCNEFMICNDSRRSFFGK